MPEAEPPPPDAVDAYWAYTASLGIQGESLRALDDRLNADFRAADGGYASLGDLPMPQRAVVSDQILVGAQGVIRNLAEARLHEQDINSLLADGVPFAEATPKAHAQSTRVDLSFVGFFRGVGSALDCLAATAIGVLRLPMSIRRASFPGLLSLSDDVARQQPAWTAFKELLSRHAEDPPGWLHWTVEMRHALMHRPRLMSLLLPRESAPPVLWLPAPAARLLMRERLRFDPHFRRRPWLPDMQHLADPYLGGLPNAVFGEKATQTTCGCFEAANRLSEAMATLLLEKWDDAEVEALAPPVGPWSLEPPRPIEFNGFVGERLRSDLVAGVISAHDEERVRLAADLHNAARAEGASAPADG
jgi:hypothetical protein